MPGSVDANNCGLKTPEVNSTVPVGLKIVKTRLSRLMLWLAGSFALNTTINPAALLTPSVLSDLTCVCEAPVCASPVMTCTPAPLRPTLAVSLDVEPGLVIVRMVVTEPITAPLNDSDAAGTSDALALAT